ncbi:MAG TPA: CDC27 family protein [Gemmataceae bacterium]|nr:CDC27 family protein [Gemmataceae bacterium]
MADDVRFPLVMALFVLFFVCIHPCLSVANSAQPGPSLETPLPAPHRLPAGPPVEEPAPAPREVGPAVPTQPASQREEPAPMPREQTPAPPPLLLPNLARTAPLAEVQRLHQQIEGLRLDCEAMLLEEMDLITAKEIKAGKGDESAKLRRRVTELLVRAAQREKSSRLRLSPSAKPQAAPSIPPKVGGTGIPPVKPGQPSSVPAEASTLPAPKPLPPPSAPSAQQPDNSSKVLTDAPVDPPSLAQSLFLSGDHAAALNAYRKLEQEEPRPDERIAIQYMIACCLRKLGKLDEAAILYREVASSHGSDILVENAQWYLRAMKERRELETQLGELRQRRQAVMPRKP